MFKRLKSVIERKEIIPTHEFGFKDKHPTIDHIHMISSIIEKTLEEKKIVLQSF